MKLPLKLWYLFEYAVAMLALGIVSVTPLPLVLACARLVGRLIYHGWGLRRRIAVDNLLQSGVCATPAAARRMARVAFQNFAVMIVETIVARRRLRPDNWDRHVKLNLSPEAKALFEKPGQGLIVASAHLGNWEVVARAAASIKPLFVVYRPFSNPYLERATHAGRATGNLRYVSRNERSPMRFFEALTRGEIVALMIDQNVLSDRVRVDFLGRPAWTTKAVAMMHLTTRVPLLAAFAIRTGPLQYEVRAVGPIACVRTGDRVKDAFEITQALTREIEKVVREFPEQYLWGHRRWDP